MRVVAILLSTGLVAAQTTTSSSPVPGSVVSSSNPVYNNVQAFTSYLAADGFNNNAFTSYSAPMSNTPISYSAPQYTSYSSAPVANGVTTTGTTTPISYNYNSAPIAFNSAPISYSNTNSIYGLSYANNLFSSPNLGYFVPQAVVTPTVVYGYQFTGYDSYGSPIISDPSQPIANAPAPVAFTQPPVNGKAQPAVTAVASYNPYWGQWLYNVDKQPTQVTTGPSVTASLSTTNSIIQSLSPVTGSIVGAASNTPSNWFTNFAPQTQYFTNSVPQTQYFTNSVPQNQYFTNSVPQNQYFANSNIYGFSQAPVQQQPINTLASAFGFTGR